MSAKHVHLVGRLVFPQAITGPSQGRLAQYPAMERIDFDESLAQVRAAGTPRRSLPVVVLSRDTAAHPMGPFIASLVAQGKLPAFVPADFGYSNERAWNQAQDALARLVPNTGHLVVSGSEHTIQIDHPQAVMDALHDVFDTSLTELAYSSSVCTRCPRSWCRLGTRRCDPFPMKGANENGTLSV
jgi:pimeloyl-ACP methyl ester carboxylesterase